MDDDGETAIAAATPEERRMAEIIWATLERIARHAAMAGDPRSGDMEVIFDGHFNLIHLARAVLRARL